MSIDFNNYGVGIADRIDLFSVIDNIENDNSDPVDEADRADIIGEVNSDETNSDNTEAYSYNEEDNCESSYNNELMDLSDMYNTSRSIINEPSYDETSELKSDFCSDITSAHIPESLDEIEQEIDRLKLRWSEVTYLIGQRLKYIADNRLYEQKGYHDFKTYVTLAIKMSENNAYYYISVFEYFTEEQTKRAGSKLKLIIPVLNKLKRDKTVSDELKAIKIKGMRDELYYKIYNKTYREAEKIITDMRQKYFTDIGKIVQFQRVRISKDKIIINEKDPEIQQKLVELIEEFYG